MADARVSAKDLVSRSLLQVRGDEYAVHDLLLDFVKTQIAKDEDVMRTATLRQSSYLGDPTILLAYYTEGNYDEGLHSLVALWRSLEEIAPDPDLEVKAYNTSVCELEESGTSSEETKEVYAALAQLFHLQVGQRRDLLLSFILHIEPIGSRRSYSKLAESIPKFKHEILDL